MKKCNSFNSDRILVQSFHTKLPWPQVCNVPPCLLVAPNAVQSHLGDCERAQSAKPVGVFQAENHFINVKYCIITAASKREVVFSRTFGKKIYRNLLQA